MYKKSEYNLESNMNLKTMMAQISTKTFPIPWFMNIVTIYNF
jgi:hypothetical protein